MLSIINEQALTAMYAEEEPLVRLLPEDSVSVTPSVGFNVFGVPSVYLQVQAAYYHYTPGYDIMRAVLEVNPATEVSCWGDLVLDTVVEREGYTVTRSIHVRLSDDEIELLKGLGKIVDIAFSVPSMVC